MIKIKMLYDEETLVEKFCDTDADVSFKAALSGLFDYIALIGIRVHSYSVSKENPIINATVYTDDVFETASEVIFEIDKAVPLLEKIESVFGEFEDLGIILLDAEIVLKSDEKDGKKEDCNCKNSKQEKFAVVKVEFDRNENVLNECGLNDFYANYTDAVNAATVCACKECDEFNKKQNREIHRFCTAYANYAAVVCYFNGFDYAIKSAYKIVRFCSPSSD